jgi:hypothetical protein
MKKEGGTEWTTTHLIPMVAMAIIIAALIAKDFLTPSAMIRH